MIHPIEIYVSQPARSIAFWTPFVQKLGDEPERWSGGMNYIDGDGDLCFL